MLPIKECKVYKCPNNCKQRTAYHPDFAEANLYGCTKCDTSEVIAKRICDFRGFVLIKFFYKEDKQMVKFKCKKGEDGHNCEIRLDELRRGRGCSGCKKDSKKKPKIEKVITKCDCREKGKCFKTPQGYLLCEHYNFAAVYPKLAEEWDYDANKGVSPYTIAPSTNKEYMFRCRRYGISYPDMINHRVTHNTICPYCFGTGRVCEGNSLLSTHPDLCKEWDYEENELMPNQVTYGSEYLASWICPNKEEGIHKYKKMIYERTGPKKKGCVKCNDKGYNQRVGGHEHFVKVANEVHNNKYSYPELYVNNKTKIKVHCPVVSTINGKLHGNFRVGPNNHKNGTGCKKCFEEQLSSKGMRHLLSLLHALKYKYNQDYETELPFPGLVYKNSLLIDIVLYLKVKNQQVQIAIEFDGLQHVRQISTWGGAEGLKKNQQRDFLKDLYFVENGISLLRFSDASLPTLQELQDLIELCKTRQVYKSYPHLQDRVKAETLLTGIHVIETSFLKQN